MSVFIIMLKLNIYLSVIATVINGLAFVAFRKWGDAIAVTISIASLFLALHTQEKQQKYKQEHNRRSLQSELSIMSQCSYYSGNILLKCAVNPGEDCISCTYFERSGKQQDRHEENQHID